MLWLIVGLILFLGVHSVRIFADGWRTAIIARGGEMRFKALYTVVSIAGFILVVWGYGQTRMAPIDVWMPPRGMTHLASLLTLVSFVLLAAAYVPRNRLRGWVGHPMTLAVKVWALAHLLANGRLADIVLFGSFLVWAIVLYTAARRRDRVAGISRKPEKPSWAADASVVIGGLVAWAVFAMALHGWLIGVRPFG